MIYLNYTTMNRKHITSTEFNDICSVAEFVYELPDYEMWVDWYDDKGNKLDVELRKIVTNRLRKEIEINKRINDLEKDFEDWKVWQNFTIL